jgi:hypothetical protein
MPFIPATMVPYAASERKLESSGDHAASAMLALNY